MGQFSGNVSRKLLGQFLSNLVCKVTYMEGIKYVNLIEIGNGKLAVPVNNTLVCHMAFLATDTQPCVLITNYLDLKKSSPHYLTMYAIHNPKAHN